MSVLFVQLAPIHRFWRQAPLVSALIHAIAVLSLDAETEGHGKNFRSNILNKSKINKSKAETPCFFGMIILDFLFSLNLFSWESNYIDEAGFNHSEG